MLKKLTTPLVDGETVAVKVTLVPLLALLAEAVIVVVVAVRVASQALAKLIPLIEPKPVT